MMGKQMLDVAIIGGGPAGLNAALVLGRARKKIVVIDEGSPRNMVTHASHGFLTRDGVAPSEFRALAKEEISVYPSIAFIKDMAISIEGSDGQFRITTKHGESFISKKILFAVGMKDRPLTIPGLAEVYGKSAFVCPYCDGWELRDEQLVIINKGAELMHAAPLISGWTNQVTICTNGPDQLTDDERKELEQHQVSVFDSVIKQIDSNDGIVEQVVLEDGTVIACRGIFFKPDLVTGSALPQALGCEITEAGMIVTDDFGKTTISGVYSAGDAASKLYQTIAAASMGALTAVAINNELNIETWKRAK